MHGALYRAHVPRKWALYFTGLSTDCTMLHRTGIGNFLAQRGLTLLCYDRRGAGQSRQNDLPEDTEGRPRPGHADSVEQLMHDAKDAHLQLQQIAMRHTGKWPLPADILGIGESFGGKVIIPFAHRHPGFLAGGVVLLSPAIYTRPEAVPPLSVRLSILSHHFFGRIIGRRMFTSAITLPMLTDSSDGLEWASRNPYLTREFTPEFFMVARALDKLTVEQATHLKQRLLVVTSLADLVIDAQKIRDTVLPAYSPSQLRHIAVDCQHLALWGESSAHIAQSIVDFALGH